MDFMKWELTSGNGFKEKVHKLAPEVVRDGMEPDRCTGSIRHTNQKISTRFMLALGVPQICKFLKIPDYLKILFQKSLIQITLNC